MTTLSMDIDKD